MSVPEILKRMTYHRWTNAAISLCTMLHHVSRLGCISCGVCHGFQQPAVYWHTIIFGKSNAVLSNVPSVNFLLFTPHWTYTRSPLAGKGTWHLLPANTSMLSTATKHYDRAANLCITVFIYKSSLHKMLEITNFFVKSVKAKFLYFHEFNF